MLLARFARLLGWLLLIIAACQLFPLVISLSLQETITTQIFIISIGLSIFLGLALLISFKDFSLSQDRRVGILVPLAIWVIVPLFAALPFAFSPYFNDYFSAYFETVSGLTTTGATLLQDPSILPRGLLFWRSSLEWLGGISVFVVTLTILPLMNIGGMKLFFSGLPKGEGETVNLQVKGAAQVLIPGYLFLTFGCFFMLLFSGENLFSAATLSLTSVSTGGFTINPGSVAVSQGGLSEWVLMIFMFLGAINVTFFWYISRGRWPRPERDKETLNLLLLSFFSALIFLILFLFNDTGPISELGFSEKLKTALFTAISATSTTGFVPSTGIANSLSVGLMILFLVMVGGATGSTAGGVKMMRVMLVFRHGAQELRRLAHRHDSKGINYNGRHITSDDLGNLWLLFFLFLLSMSFGLLFLSALGLDFHQAMNVAVASITNSGPTAYLMDPDFLGYQSLNSSQQLVTLLLMIFGRFEGVLILAMIAKNFWDH